MQLPTPALVPVAADTAQVRAIMMRHLDNLRDGMATRRREVQDRLTEIRKFEISVATWNLQTGSSG